MRHLKEVFELIDEDKNGRLSYDELKKGLGQLEFFTGHKEVVIGIDCDHNGENECLIKKIFKKCDLNDSG